MSDVHDEAAEAAVDFTLLASQASNLFFHMMEERHEMGQQKYGAIKFMEVNTLKEAMEEVVDLGNYAMYTFLKLYVLNQQLQKLLPEEGHEPLGAAAFMKSGE
jgi:hypothetical protein